MTDPVVSVVVPAHNAAGTITATLESVRAQRYGDFEVVVVDDGSTDDTVARVERIGDPRIRVLRVDHGGAGAARNAGIAASTGRLVSFLDSDDLWLPTYLDAMLAALESEPSAGFAFTDAWLLDARTNRVRRTPVFGPGPAVSPPADPRTFLRSLIRVNFVYTSVTLPRAVLDDVGGFDETLAASIDYELWLRIAASGRVGVRAPGLHAVYRAHRPGSISSSRARVVEGMITVHRLVAERYPVEEDERRLALELISRETEELDSLRGGRSLHARWLRLKPTLAAARNAVLRRHRWYDTPPSELTEALPGLLPVAHHG